MALKLLQPGLRPIGQFDLEDDHANALLGGELGLLEALETSSDAYASDSAVVGPAVQITLGTASDGAQFCGLIDEGTAGEGNYGTLFGTVIGGTAGQGTGKGTLSSAGVVTVGPRTNMASGKATLFAQPGLYGVTADALTLTSLVLNSAVNGNSSTGKLEQVGDTVGRVGSYLGSTNDSSLVSTTFTHASGSAGDAEYHAIWFSGYAIFSA
jgi:hypothetical protein